MNRTSAIFIVAAILTLVAVVLGRGKEDPSPKVPGIRVSSGTLGLAALPSTSHVRQGGNGEVFLDINLAAPATQHVKRLPLNIGLVIDRSGSMAGQKLANAREAATQLVSRLRDGDRIAIVTYGSDVTVLVPSTVVDTESRATMINSISTIVDRGGTFLSGGLERGREQVLRHGRNGFVNRVILISDGQANEGITSPGELSALSRATLGQGVNVTTMGVGLDFNEEVMTAMAEHGGGHYYFIQNSSAMARFFTEELDTMTAVVARTATMQLDLEPGVELLDLYGYAFEQQGRTVRVNLPDLFSGQTRRIICHLRVPAGREGKVTVGQVKLSYVDVDSGRSESVTGEAQVAVTSDDALVERGKDREVLARAEQVQAAATMNQAMKAYADGDVAGSQRLLRRQIARTRSANALLKDKALDEVTRVLEGQVIGTTNAPPSSSAGRALIKSGKYRAYKLGK